MTTETAFQHLVLYDGECGFCSRSVRFILHRDPGGAIRYAPLQSSKGKALIAKHGAAVDLLDTVILVEHIDTDKERVLVRAEGACHVAIILGGVWRLFGRFGLLLPRALTDALYRVIAKYRLRIFGTTSACPVALPAERARFFLD